MAAVFEAYFKEKYGDKLYGMAPVFNWNEDGSVTITGKETSP